jgi:hypothetical protein
MEDLLAQELQDLHIVTCVCASVKRDLLKGQKRPTMSVTLEDLHSVTAQCLVRLARLDYLCMTHIVTCILLLTAQCLVRLARLDYLRYEVLPIVRPLMLENLDEDEIELAQLRPRALQGHIIARIPVYA